MRTLTIYGASDDLIESDGLPGCDEFNVYPDGSYAGAFRVQSKESTITVHCIYAGHWCFAVGPEDDDYEKLPDWPIRRKWGDNSAYSETIEIDCPDDARVKFYPPSDDEE